MSGHKTRPWEPLRLGEINPRADAHYRADFEEGDVDRVEVWHSTLYQVVAVRLVDGRCYLSIKRNDRHAIRDWRHLQQIKNEVAGPEVEAVEVFPAESRLVDESNQFHLWCLPEGEQYPIGYPARAVKSPEEIREFNRATKDVPGMMGARQRAWQPGLTTGAGGKQ